MLEPIRSCFFFDQVVFYLSKQSFVNLLRYGMEKGGQKCMAWITEHARHVAKPVPPLTDEVRQL